MRVKVFRDHNRETFRLCIQALPSYQLGTADRVTLAGAEIKYDPVARKRWEEGERPNTHAWIEGDLISAEGYNGKGFAPTRNVALIEGAQSEEVRYDIESGKFVPEFDYARYLVIDGPRILVFAF